MPNTNPMVAHKWANAPLENGRYVGAEKSSNGNFSFEGSRIYSYRTCIARRYTPDETRTKGPWFDGFEVEK